MKVYVHQERCVLKILELSPRGFEMKSSGRKRRARVKFFKTVNKQNEDKKRRE